MLSNDRRTKLFPKILAGQLSVGLVVVIISLSAIFYAYGYRLNYSNLKIVKTGIASFNFTPKDASLYIDNKFQKGKNSIVINLLPARYHFAIKKDGYADWNRTIELASGSVTVFDNIVLFKNPITTSILTDQHKIDLLNSPTDILATQSANEVTADGYEIWAGNNLVTRFSSPIGKVAWYPDSSHIIFQQGNEIRVIEIDGMNDTLLVTLTDNKPANFAVGSGGKELYFTDNGQYKVAEIR